jgi:hypothetical protein
MYFEMLFVLLVVASGECGDEPSGSGTTDLISCSFLLLIHVLYIGP